MTAARCRIVGHDLGFRAQGRELVWECRRGCPDAGGVKRYRDAAAARRYAAAFDRPERADLGRRAPLLGLFPLRIWRGLRRARTAASRTER